MVLALALILGDQAAAQVDTGAILGTVEDQTGAVVPGAKVTLLNEGTGLPLTTTSAGRRRLHFYANQDRGLHRRG